jgi:hypothetical protein
MAVKKTSTAKTKKSASNSTSVRLYNLAAKKKSQRASGNTSDTRGATKGMNYYLGEMKKNAAKQITAKREKQTGNIEPTAKQKAAYIPTSKVATKSSRPSKRR